MSRYFAYGSNLHRRRLEERIGAVEIEGVGRLHDHRFTVDKPGLDGSAKANVVPEPGATVWGVVFRLPSTRLPALDRFEGGYLRHEVRIELAAGRVPCWTYRAQGRCDALPFDWYMEHVVRGAEEHGLPSDWRRMLAQIAAKPAE